MKYLNKILVLGVLSCFIFWSCEKEEVIGKNEQSSEQVETLSSNKSNQERYEKIRHNYEYRGKRFQITYVYDNEKQDVVDVDGDVEYAERIFGNEKEAPQGILFENSEKGSREFAVKLFDSSREMDEYITKVGDLPNDREILNNPKETNGEVGRKMGPCYSPNGWGYGNFYFYQHTFYNGEMTGLRRLNRRYTYNHWVGSSYNDKLSSIYVDKPLMYKAYLRLYQHSCYNGRSIAFFKNRGYGDIYVPNLKYYTMSGWWWWKKSWNDQVSSTKGFVWK